jgi:ribosomal protein S18 acetylase RimI-like enzyme
MLLLTQQLDSATLHALEQLMQQCKQHDGNMIAYYPKLLSNPRLKPATLLQYNTHQQLIGFASVFFFELNVADIALAVTPTQRQHGIAHQLLQHLLMSIQQERPVDIIRFSLPSQRYTEILTQRHFTYHHSEYDMETTVSADLCLDHHDELQVITARSTHIACLQALDKQCFPHSLGFSTERFIELINDPHYVIRLLVYRGEVIGKAHLSFDPNSTRLSDIAILPAYQGQGFGRKLITHCMQHAASTHTTHMNLSVEAKNTQALRLYQHLGFTISNAIDFWQIPFSRLV